MNKVKSEIAAHAEDVLQNYTQLTLPICPFSIAEKVDIIVRPKDSHDPGISGFLMRVGNQFGIQYAKHIKNEGFIRFTVSHELGHYFLPEHSMALFRNGDGLHKSNSGLYLGNKYEKEADDFASSLLMPDDLFRSELQKRNNGFKTILEMADLFKTSITATAIKYAKFSDFAVAVIVSKEDKVEYCFMSELLKGIKGIRWIKKGDFIPRQSGTFSFNQDPINISNAKSEEESSLLDLWFDNAPSVEMNEDIMGLGSYERTLTVLFTDEIIETEEDDDEDIYSYNT
jgi:Zn-dependent peptidase ImmA (M78 family)